MRLFSFRNIRAAYQRESTLSFTVNKEAKNLGFNRMKKIIKLFIKSSGNQKQYIVKYRVSHKNENDLKDAKNKGDKIFKTALQYAYCKYAAEKYS